MACRSRVVPDAPTPSEDAKLVLMHLKDSRLYLRSPSHQAPDRVLGGGLSRSRHHFILRTLASGDNNNANSCSWPSLSKNNTSSAEAFVANTAGSSKWS